VGSTIFNVHIHASLACSDCSVVTDSSNLIPLLATEPVSAPKEAAPDTYVTKTKAQKEQERRDKMRGLKEQFLKPASAKAAPSWASPSTDGAASSSKPAFIDRAAARRSRTGAPTQPSSVSSSYTGSSSPFFAVPGSRTAPDYSSTPSAPPSNPFGATSKGAVLLSKLGGGDSASSSTSSTQSGLGTLIQPKSFTGGSREERPGLGSRSLTVVSGGEESSALGAAGGEKRGWREDVREANRKRFREM
jgi:hypothetical protein